MMHVTITTHICIIAIVVAVKLKWPAEWDLHHVEQDRNEGVEHDPV